jgi:hypothetical protein
MTGTCICVMLYISVSWKNNDTEEYKRVFSAVFNRQEIVSHGLVSEFMDKWRDHIHSSVCYQ